MLAENVRALIEQGENARVAFKTCRDRLTRNIYETICSFLNRCGGYILLGVAGRGEIIGLEPDAIRSVSRQQKYLTWRELADG